MRRHVGHDLPRAAGCDVQQGPEEGAGGTEPVRVGTADGFPISP